MSITSKWTTSAPAANEASTSAPNLAKSADKMEGAIKKSFSGMMSSILTADRDARAGRAAGSVRVATSALEAVRARATIRDCIFSLTCGGRRVHVKSRHGGQPSPLRAWPRRARRSVLCYAVGRDSARLANMVPYISRLHHPSAGGPASLVHSSIALAVRGDARAGWCKHEGTARQLNGASLLLLLQGPSAVSISTSLAPRCVFDAAVGPRFALLASV